MNKKQLGIYVHIPFCVQKCAYCDFLSAPADDKTKQKYVDALIEEIKQTQWISGLYTEDESANKTEIADISAEYTVHTVFFGGGTPSVLKTDQIKAILEAIRATFEMDEFAEITMECNPGTLDDKKTFGYRECGINRISFGLQSAVDSDLKMLGRIHSLQDFEQSFNMARKYGFNNINVDIMSAIPGQTVSSYERTLNSVIAYGPEHISAYSLIVEEGTHIYENIDDYPALPSEDVEREMYHMTERLLHRSGYERYEISNYSKPGYECQHNLSYWDRRDYLGFGIGAASLFKENRYSNCRDINKYIAAHGAPFKIREKMEKLTIQDRMEEFMFLGLRKTKGVDDRDFAASFQLKLQEIYGDMIEANIQKGLLKRDGHYYRLTAYGLDISNTVMSDFMF